ncbi:hypothetical protein SLS56_005311 [Neofusicoccum ribis]|uniref:Uncharacterized protein n=1 Tax=Neofusicoccum ribis TaxID=45134 RepID=A0ABR3SUG3_9PEZI
MLTSAVFFPTFRDPSIIVSLEFNAAFYLHTNPFCTIRIQSFTHSHIFISHKSGSSVHTPSNPIGSIGIHSKPLAFNSYSLCPIGLHRIGLRPIGFHSKRLYFDNIHPVSHPPNHIDPIRYSPNHVDPIRHSPKYIEPIRDTSIRATSIPTVPTTLDTVVRPTGLITSLIPDATVCVPGYRQVVGTLGAGGGFVTVATLAPVAALAPSPYREALGA